MSHRQLPPAIKARFTERLRALCALPSVAATGQAQAETAALVASQLEDLGLHVEIHGTAGAPVVFAEKRVPGKPTVMFYNHYDVQPPEPLELWDSDPFTLTERDGQLFARGAADDKGDLAARLAGLEWLAERHAGELPVGVVFVVEGEEEVGSPNLTDYVEANRERLQADVCVWEFGGVDSAGRPELNCGLKGILAVDLQLRTAAYDQHSARGPVIQNAVWKLAAAVASLRDMEGNALIEGFYDDVTPLTELQRQLLQSAPAEDSELARTAGVDRFLGDATGGEFQRRLQTMPVINVNGLHGGYGGQGTKTVLPATASAKLDIRLVPGQRPKRILELLKAHLESHGFGDVQVTEAELPGLPSRVDPADTWIRHAAAALEEAYGQPAVIKVSSGGSGPLHAFNDVLGMPVAMLGVSHGDSRAHSPNENIRWEDVHKGTYALVRAIERWAGLQAEDVH